MKLTIKYKLNTTIEHEKHLGNLCFYATKLYNTANYDRRKIWEASGKIPNYNSQTKDLKNNHWYKLLPSQTAQDVLKVIEQNYKSWFKLRKTHAEANPPRFRKKSMLSPIAFKQLFKIIDDKLRISMSRKYSQEQKIKFIEIPFIEWKSIAGKSSYCQIMKEKDYWYVHVVYNVDDGVSKPDDNVMALDLGIINTAVAVDTFGNSKIYSGKQILAMQHYFNKERSKLTSVLTKQYPKRHHSKSLDILQKKQSRQIMQSLHTFSKKIIEDCLYKKIKTLCVGDLTDIRKDNDKGKLFNQKLHSWSFSKFTQLLEYKAIQSGIRFVRVNESNTSRTCSCCGMIRKSNRIHRGYYKCKACGSVMNADANGAKNILKKYLQDFVSRSIGNVAMPSVVRLTNVVPCEV